MSPMNGIAKLMMPSTSAVTALSFTSLIIYERVNWPVSRLNVADAVVMRIHYSSHCGSRPVIAWHLGQLSGNADVAVWGEA